MASSVRIEFPFVFVARLEMYQDADDSGVGYFDDNIKGGEGQANTVGGQVDVEQARPVA